MKKVKCNTCGCVFTSKVKNINLKCPECGSKESFSVR